MAPIAPCLLRNRDCCRSARAFGRPAEVERDAHATGGFPARRATDGAKIRVFTDIPYLAAKVRTPEFLDLVSLTFTERKPGWAAWSSASLVKTLQDKKYELVILHEPADAPYTPGALYPRYSRLDSNVRTAVSQNYGLCFELDSSYVYGRLSAARSLSGTCPIVGASSHPIDSRAGESPPLRRVVRHPFSKSTTSIATPPEFARTATYPAESAIRRQAQNLQDAAVPNGRLKMAIFGKPTKLLWGAVALTAVVFELIPVHYPAGVFLTHNYCKAGIFLLLGFLTPLAFWRFNSLNARILLIAGSAILAEVMQAVLADGHRFSLVELGIKLVLIGAGFIIALNVRYEHNWASERDRSWRTR